ncbi:hypothetical protein DNTS_005389 [Danionella cerebrum]|uniref:Uncharacterized protein n=1 Tax=Danionella cerebrum TaxID=2873325 RepID=A0A553RFV6_9TELE|nr:hypothetical protein DNTS_005389 [Danionella translucida]
MALGESCCTVGKSKTWISCRTGLMLFLLLQMTLISEVYLDLILSEPTPASTPTGSTTTSNTEQSSTVPTSASSSPTSASPISSSSPSSASSVSSSTSPSSASSVSSSTSPSSSSSSPSSASPVSSSSSPSSASPVSSSSSSPSSASSVSSSSSTSSSSSVSSSTSTSSSSSVSPVSAASSNNTANSTANSTNTANGPSLGMMHCPSFMCTSDCYSQYMNISYAFCPVNTSFCEIMKLDVGYSVNCNASCRTPCANGTLSNCSLTCCNTTNCINSTLYALSSASTTTVPSFTVYNCLSLVINSNHYVNVNDYNHKAHAYLYTSKYCKNTVKKCHSVKCDGTACYKTNPVQSSCAAGLDYCMLKKTLTGTAESWEAGCSADCRKMTVCSGTVSPCYLECCNATTTTSCLKMTGEVNMPSSANRFSQSPVLLTTTILLLWILKVFT